MSRLYGGVYSDMGKARTKRAHSWIEAYVKSWSGEARMHMEDTDTVKIDVTNLNVKIGNERMFVKKDIDMDVIKEHLHSEIKMRLRKHQRFPKKEWDAFFNMIAAMELLDKVETK